ncbi:electron transfer flavoprotein subunit alpha/FixB family protein [Ferroacidibacillus organovorans]|uniref:Electron transfer flavoprotein subunit alpha n=1 Tax=Ferroacidibacillus organovorans TaxID=1765683 RepID=A0A117SX90_9BACL|nr:electron transfer flavoprotein subunit alpha/FixB family protein [Ferroacidibacillus organovorans]KUO94998.1 electron transfer flavoprotein subunit alpha [Ferroacidibacillus organovorans]
MQDVLVVADLRGATLRNVTLEALYGAGVIAQGGRVTALLCGHNVSSLAETLFAHGAHEVLVVDDERLQVYQPELYRKAVQAAVDEVNPRTVLFAHSAVGRDLAPAIAALYRAGQVSDVIGIAAKDDQVIYTRPVYAGKAFTKNEITGDLAIVTIRPNNLPVSEFMQASKTAKKLDVSFGGDLRTTIKDVMKKVSGGVDLTEAKIIVSGGRGVKSAEGFEPLRELARVLGAAVGASRGACDAGYCDYAMQIGQTGKVVTPDLYIACGISGAIQHLAGMSNAKVIVAINKDPEAPIFKVADYGIVGDLFEVVPALTQELRAFLG